MNELSVHGNSTFNQEIADQICDRMMKGETVRQICLDDTMPNRNTLSRWLIKHENFRNQYAFARNIQLQNMHDEILELADNPDIKTDKNWVNQTRLQIDVRKWYLSKVISKMPPLRGSFGSQADQVNESLRHGEINLDVAEFLLRLIQTKSALAPVDEYKKELDEIKALLTKK